MSDRINRREFIKRSAATGAGAGLTLGMSRRAGAAFDNTDNPNGRVTLGFIGTGARAHQVLDDVMKVPGFEVVALCDAYRGRLDHAVEMTKGRAKTYKDHRELLAAPGPRSTTPTVRTGASRWVSSGPARARTRSLMT